MGLETATYINGLVTTNPTSSDPKSQGDDHLRLVKSTVKATFPNITGAVTPTQADLNVLLGSGTTPTLGGAVYGTGSAYAATAAGTAGQVLTSNGASAPTWQTSSGSSGLRNRIINGGMTIDQRNAGAAVTPIANSYGLDRFFINITQASKITIQQVTDAPTGFKYSNKISVATQYSPISTDNFNFIQAIEGFNCIDLAFGTASASAICVSFWVKGSVAGTYNVSLRNGAGARSYVGTISVTTSWAKQTITLTGDTTGTWLTDSGIGMFLSVDLGSGTNFNTTAGAWQAGNFTRTAGSVSFVNQTAGATLNITGVQLELGSTATPFEQRPHGMELALCQRYYYKILNTSTDRYYSGSVSAVSATRIIASVFTVPCPLRVSPTMTYSGLDVYNSSYSFVGAVTSLSVYAGGTSQTPSLNIFLASGMTTGSQYIATLPATTGYVDFSAEL